mmetsp:Transcript_3193/g.11561  ORF Transcript_3193/g.11561 Transcript_3193/m.11561 type:complete len:401 (-) Transcript_3193:236-1438(-)
MRHPPDRPDVLAACMSGVKPSPVRMADARASAVCASISSSSAYTSRSLAASAADFFSAAALAALLSGGAGGAAATGAAVAAGAGTAAAAAPSAGAAAAAATAASDAAPAAASAPPSSPSSAAASASSRVRSRSVASTTSSAVMSSPFTSCSTCMMRMSLGMPSSSYAAMARRNDVLPMPLRPTRPYRRPATSFTDASSKRMRPGKPIVKFGQKMSRMRPAVPVVTTPLLSCAPVAARIASISFNSSLSSLALRRAAIFAFFLALPSSLASSNVELPFTYALSWRPHMKSTMSSPPPPAPPLAAPPMPPPPPLPSVIGPFSSRGAPDPASAAAPAPPASPPSPPPAPPDAALSLSKSFETSASASASSSTPLLPTNPRTASRVSSSGAAPPSIASSSIEVM